MFLIPLILTVGLDMSLPEFQPQPDLSGNVIVGSFDKEDPVDVMPLEDISINEILKDDVSDNDKKKTSDVSLNDSAKDSGGISAKSGTRSATPVAPDGYHYETMTSSNLASTRIETVNNVRQLVSRSGYSQNYFYLESGHTYYMTTSGSNIYFGSDITIGTVIDVHTGSTWEYSPSSNVYVFSSGVYTFDCYELIADSISGDSYEDVVYALALIDTRVQGIGSDVHFIVNDVFALLELVERVVNLLRAILFCLLITFLYPIALSIVRNIVGGDSNV